jgi:hypothetical protein
MAFHENEVIVVSGTVVGLTPANLSTGYPRAVVLSVEDAPIRLTLSGVDPDNGDKNGLVLLAGSVVRVSGSRDMANIRMIATTGTDASVSAMYEQEG